MTASRGVQTDRRHGQPPGKADREADEEEHPIGMQTTKAHVAPRRTGVRRGPRSELSWTGDLRAPSEAEPVLALPVGTRSAAPSRNLTASLERHLWMARVCYPALGPLIADMVESGGLGRPIGVNDALRDEQAVGGLKQLKRRTAIQPTIDIWGLSSRCRKGRGGSGRCSSMEWPRNADWLR